MKITFNKNDFLKFFNMISVYKTYVEVADKVEIEPPISAIDALLFKLTELIITNKWFSSSSSDEKFLYSAIQFMLWTAKIKIDKDIEMAFNVQDVKLSIDIDNLWNYLLANGIEV